MKTSIHRFPHLRIFAVLALALAAARPGLAGPPTVLHDFDDAVNFDGNGPLDGLVWGGDGNFYGTTRMGGGDSEGTVFSISAGGVFTPVWSFFGAPDPGGDTPLAKPAVFSGGGFIGTTHNDGTSSAGAVYLLQYNPSGPPCCTGWGVAQTYDFTGGNDGGFPEGALILGSDGNYYGTTSAGGLYGHGTVFQLNPLSLVPSTIYAFTGGADGDHPVGALVQGSDGNFYGVTEYGGNNSYGTVFSIGQVWVGESLVWSLNTLHRFTSGADGAFPNGGLVQGTDGLFYGTTQYGGTAPNPTLGGGGGTVYKMDSAGHVTPLHSFGDDHPQPLMQATDGNFYGATTHGSSAEPNGTIFQITPSGALTTLWTFSGTDGSNPSGALVQYNNSTTAYLCGVTSQGGANDNGTVFTLAVALPLTSSIITGQAFGAGGGSMNMVSTAGATVQLQSVDTLGQTWGNVGSPVQSGGGLVTLTFPSQPVKTQGFFRVMVTLPAVQ